MRITDQYFWNFIFTVFFTALVVLGAIILESEAYKPLGEATVMDLALISLASFRLIRLFVYDKIMAFFREQFYDAKKTRSQIELIKPEGGPKRTVLELLICPWCFGVWAAAFVTFFYFLTPFSLFPILFLAISGIASFIQITANLIGHRAEYLKHETKEK